MNYLFNCSTLESKICKERKRARKIKKRREGKRGRRREYNNNITFKDFKNSPKANFPFQTLSRMPYHTFNYSYNQITSK